MEDKEIIKVIKGRDNNDDETKYTSEDVIALRDAIKLIKSHGYVVKKLTKGQLEDAEECERCGFEGDCSGCRCSVCIMQ